MKDARHEAMRRLEGAALKSLAALLSKRKASEQLHRAWRLTAAIYAFCRRLPHSSFITERALFYHLKSTFTKQRSLSAALHRLTTALNCPRQ